MGTNYYIHKPSTTKCNHCGHDSQTENNIIHIGKSSFGWCFALRIHPQLGINTLDDWKQLWNNPENIIKNEYDEFILPGHDHHQISRKMESRRKGTTKASY